MLGKGGGGRGGGWYVTTTYLFVDKQKNQI